MAITQEELLQRTEALLEKGVELLKTRNQHRAVDITQRAGYRAAGLTLIRALFGEAHHYYVDFNSHANGGYESGYQAAQGILQIVKDDVRTGWLTSTTALIAGEVFSDFLEMANHLQKEGYKDAAAVIAGSSLEAHLKRLCAAHNVGLTNDTGVPKKAELLNAELSKAGAYILSEQKQVTAWLGIRNDAAHGDYGKVIPGSVQLMIDGVRHFMTMHPA